MHDEEAEASYRKGTGTPEVHLSAADKMDLLKPLLFRYMLSLCLVYIAEYVINSVRPIRCPVGEDRLEGRR